MSVTSSPPIRIRPPVGSISRLIILQAWWTCRSRTGPTKTTSLARLDLHVHAVDGRVRAARIALGEVLQLDGGAGGRRRAPAAGVGEASSSGRLGGRRRSQARIPLGMVSRPIRTYAASNSRARMMIPSVPASTWLSAFLLPRRGDAAEDLVAEAGAGGVGGDGRDAHQHLGGDPDAGQDRRPGQRQLHPQQPGHAGTSRCPWPRRPARGRRPRRPTIALRTIGSSPYSVSAMTVGGTPRPTIGISRPIMASEGMVRIGRGGRGGEVARPLAAVGDDADEHADERSPRPCTGRRRWRAGRRP